MVIWGQLATYDACTLCAIYDDYNLMNYDRRVASYYVEKTTKRNQHTNIPK